ncbi:MAG: UDP-2,3-diacylglucosamine diphosphatase [Gemmatimonadetes bacterium]|nr:UDP-2,3-diacylglucosamine diphosphatase [Gemmatimonadota bacterium]
MPHRAVYLASDIHLGAIPAERAAAFRRWLEHAGARADTVVVNGDLFDFWFEYRHAIPAGYARELGALAALVDAGVEVHLTGGNHDWWGGRFLEQEIGVRFHRDPVEMELAGHTTLVAHGDGLGPGDVGYKILKSVLRNPIFVWAFRWLHPDLGARVAGRVSSTEERPAIPPPVDARRAEVLEEWAVGHLGTHPRLDLLTLGHTHWPRLREVGTGRWYLNTGDWVHHCTYAVLEPGKPPALMRWRDGSGEIWQGEGGS